MIPRVRAIKAMINIKLEWVSCQELHYDLSIGTFKYINILYKGVDISSPKNMQSSNFLKNWMISFPYYYQWLIFAITSSEEFEAFPHIEAKQNSIAGRVITYCSWLCPYLVCINHPVV